MRKLLRDIYDDLGDDIDYCCPVCGLPVGTHDGKCWFPRLKKMFTEEIRPFDKVLVRNSEDAAWTIDIFVRQKTDGYYECFRYEWKYCLPYEGNEHLVGKKDNFKFGDHVEMRTVTSLTTWTRAVVVQEPEKEGEPYLVVAENFPADSCFRNACDLRHAYW